MQIHRTNSGWADPEISSLVESFGRMLEGGNVDDLSADAKKVLLAEDIRLVASECPNLKNIQLYLFGDSPYLDEIDGEVWRPFLSLRKLQQLNLIAHQWSEAVALVR